MLYNINHFGFYNLLKLSLVYHFKELLLKLIKHQKQKKFNLHQTTYHSHHTNHRKHELPKKPSTKNKDRRSGGFEGNQVQAPVETRR